MDDKYELTIIVPIYNVEDWIVQCLDSVVGISGIDYEVILVDDGSTDCSGSIARNYSERNPSHFRFISQTNSGQSAARNTGLNFARGKYIFFLDSDDFVNPDALFELLASAVMHDLDIAVGNGYRFIDGKFSKTEVFREISSIFNNDLTVTGTYFLNQFLQSGYTNTFVTDKLFKRDFIERHSFSFVEGLILEDVIFSFNTYLKAESVRYFDIKFYNYRIRSGGTMETKFSDWGLRRRKVVEIINNIVKENQANTSAINGFMVFQYYTGFKFDGYASPKQIKEFLSMELKAKKKIQCILMLMLSVSGLGKLFLRTH